MNPSDKNPETIVTETEVTEKTSRRKFSASYKRKILQAADRCTTPGELGALLRREGLYSSQLAKWRELREQGELAGLTPKQRGPKAAEVNPLAKTVAAQEREIAKLRVQLQKAEIVCAVQKKLSELLGITLPTEAEMSLPDAMSKKKP